MSRASSGRSAQVMISTPSGGSTGGGVISRQGGARGPTHAAPRRSPLLREGKALGVVVEHRYLDLLQAALGGPRGDRAVERGAGTAAAPLWQHPDHREDTTGSLRQDDADRRADSGTVQPGQE